MDDKTSKPTDEPRTPTPPADDLPAKRDARRFSAIRLALPRIVTFFLLLMVLLLVHFALLRLGLILRNHNDTSGATTPELAVSFLTGARFDAAVSAYLILPFALVAFIPGIALDRSRRHRKIFFVVFLITLGFVTFTALAEYEFFHEFQTRYNRLAIQYLDQPATVAGMAWYNYPVFRYVAIWLAIMVVFALALRMLMRWSFETLPTPADKVSRRRATGEVAAIFALVVIFVLCLRGGIKGEPLRWGDAFHSHNDFVNQVSLNGIFTLGNTISNSFSKKDLSGNWSKRMDLDEARKITRAMVLQTDETLIDPTERTLMRLDAENDADETVQLKTGPRPPNVVLILMESMSARFLGAAGAPKTYGPNLDKLATEGIFFKRAFSSGTHTHQGIFSTILSFPNLPGYEYLMQNTMGNQPFSSLPSILSAKGYDTMFLYNGKLEWDNMHGFLRSQGVKKFIGADDFAPTAKRDRVWGVNDYDMFMRANDEFDIADKNGPFFAFVLNLSNHVPFQLPDPLPFEPTTGLGEENRRMDAYRYADWSIGQFIEKAKTKPYFDHTLFVFIGDHGFHVPPRLTEVQLLWHHVPLIFYGPGVLPNGGVVRNDVVTQVNITPSILGLLKINAPAASWGRDMFSKDFTTDNFAMFKGSGGDPAVALVRDDRLLVAGADGKPKLFQYSLGFPPSAIEFTGPDAKTQTDTMYRELEAYVQSAIDDLSHHRAGPDEKKHAQTEAPASTR